MNLVSILCFCVQLSPSDKLFIGETRFQGSKFTRGLNVFHSFSRFEHFDLREVEFGVISMSVLSVSLNC